MNVLNRDPFKLRRGWSAIGAGAIAVLSSVAPGIAAPGIAVPMAAAASSTSTDPAEDEGDEDTLTAENLIETLRTRYMELDSYEDEVIFKEVQKYEGKDRREFTRRRQSLAFTSDGRLAFKSVSTGYQEPQVNAALYGDGERFVEVRPNQKRFRVYEPADSIEGLVDQLEAMQPGQNEAAHHPVLAMFEAIADNDHNIYAPQGAEITSIDEDGIDDEGSRTISGTIGHALPFTLVLDAEHGIIRQLKIDLAPLAGQFAGAHGEDAPAIEKYHLFFDVQHRAVNEPIDNDRFTVDIPIDYVPAGP